MRLITSNNSFENKIVNCCLNYERQTVSNTGFIYIYAKRCHKLLYQSEITAEHFQILLCSKERGIDPTKKKNQNKQTIKSGITEAALFLALWIMLRN